MDLNNKTFEQLKFCWKNCTSPKERNELGNYIKNLDSQRLSKLVKSIKNLDSQKLSKLVESIKNRDLQSLLNENNDLGKKGYLYERL